MRNVLKGYSIRHSILIPTILIVVLSLITVASFMFSSYQNTTSEIVQDSSKEINKQIILNFENYIESVIDTADYIQQKTTEYGLQDNTSELFEVFNQAVEVQSDIESIVLIGISGNNVVSSSFRDISTDDLTQKEWYLDAMSDASIYHFSSPHIQDVFEESDVEVITVTKLVDYYINDVKYTGILIVDINTSSIITLTETTNLGDGGHIVILNDDDTLIYSNNDECVSNECTSVQIAREIIVGGESVVISNISMYANVNTLRDTRWRMATFINTDIINQTRNSNLIVLGVILASTLIVTIAATSFISNRISSPINQLKDHMLLIEKGNFYKEIEISGQREVVMLNHSFNSMIAEIRSLMETVVLEQKAKRKTEFQALQNQINPHFLYNTLDSIVYLAENKLNDKVIEMVIALSKFFRISISKGKNIILLKEELEHARNYLLIQQIRYNEKFEFKFEIDDDVLDYKVVKLSLQPLIENAIYHGINTEYDAGRITIRAYKKANKLVLEVEDDGYGITDEMIEELYDRIQNEAINKSVGLKNVYQRLQIYYGTEAEFLIESELDEKTIIKLVIPLERAV